jgi:hypothetical protein
MDVRWAEEVGIGRAGPVAAVMADGVLVRDHGDGDGIDGIKGFPMKRLTTRYSINLSTFF